MIAKFLTAVRSTDFSVPTGRHKWNIRRVLSAWLTWLQRCRRNAATRKELADVPSYLYQDIGLTKQQVEHEIRKNFWQ